MGEDEILRNLLNTQHGECCELRMACTRRKKETQTQCQGPLPGIVDPGGWDVRGSASQFISPIFVQRCTEDRNNNWYKAPGFRLEVNCRST